MFHFKIVFFIFLYTTGPHVLLNFGAGELITDLELSTLLSLCPEVDICDRNATSAVLKPNGYLDVASKVSCCQGCSCHQDCIDHQNCCYQQENITLTAKANYRKCRYMQHGMQEEQLDATIPAYFVVSKEPSGGCINKVPFKTRSGRTLKPSCGPSPVAQWGNFFPELSNYTRNIYKNEACARCHGVEDSEPFTPLLTCERKSDTRLLLSVVEYLQIYENKKLSPYCHYKFIHEDETILQENRCIKDVISTCTSDDIPPIPGSDLSAIMIKSACENGWNVSVVVKTVAFKNVFCAHCNGKSAVLRNLICRSSSNDPREFDNTKFTFILREKYIEPGKSKTSRRNEKKPPYPVACLKKNASWVENSCRKIMCPSGMIRDRKDDCVYVSDTWITEGFHLHVKLKPTVTENLTDLIDDPNAFVDALMLKSPWPSQWEPSGLYLKLQNSLVKNEDSLFTITLSSSDNSYMAESLVNTMKECLQRPWILETNTTFVYFEQSLLEYDFARFPNEAFSSQAWIQFASENQVQTQIMDMASANWKRIYISVRNNLRNPSHLDNMFLCEQINLKETEFGSIVDHFIIKNKLTNQYLYNRQFVLMEDENGNRTVRVCLSDTPLVSRESNDCYIQSPVDILVVVNAIALVIGYQ